MTADSTAPLLAAILAHLAADPAVAALAGDRLWFTAPEEPPPASPYVTAGPIQVLPFEAQGWRGAEIHLTLDAWAYGPGAAEAAMRVSAALAASLDRLILPVAGHRHQRLQHETTRLLRDPDGLTMHGAVGFEAFTIAADGGTEGV